MAVPIGQRCGVEPLVFGADHDGVAAGPVGGGGDGETVRQGRIQIADRFPAGVIHVQFQLPFPLVIPDGPECDAAGENLRDHKRRAGVCHTRAAGEQLPVEMQRRLTAVDEADVDERTPVPITQRRVEQAGIEARGCVAPI